MALNNERWGARSYPFFIMSERIVFSFWFVVAMSIYEGFRKNDSPGVAASPASFEFLFDCPVLHPQKLDVSGGRVDF